MDNPCEGCEEQEYAADGYSCVFRNDDDDIYSMCIKWVKYQARILGREEGRQEVVDRLREIDKKSTCMDCRELSKAIEELEQSLKEGGNE